MHSKPMTTEERGKKGLLARHESAVMFPHRYPSLHNFLKAISTVPVPFPTPNPENRKSVFTLAFWHELLQRLNQISLPTGMTIPITAAVTVESKPWSLFASVITEVILII